MSRDEMAMVNLSDENRDLLLSLYLDGELEPDQAEAVAEKIRSDETWQREYALLRSSETRITKVVESNWHDEDFNAAVRERLRDVPPPAVTPPASPARGRWPLWGLMVLIAAGAIFLLTRPHKPKPDAPTSAPQAHILEGKARIGDAEAGQEAVLKAEDELTAVSPFVTLRWVDGSRIWLREGTIVRSTPHGGPDFTRGQALIQTASGGDTLWVTSPGGGKQGKIGLSEGLFQLEVVSDGLAICVFAGNARQQDGTLARTHDELTPGGLVRGIDARLLHLWVEIRESPNAKGIKWPPLWSQAGGAADHSGLTPLHGPAALKKPRLCRVEEGREIEEISPAVIAGDGAIHVAWQSSPDEVVFCRLGDVADGGARAVVARMPGRLIGAPAITLSGLVLAATTGKVLRAEGRSGMAWEKDLGSAISAVATLPDGSIVCSTFQRLVALDEGGNELWSYQGLADFQPPVALCRDGTLLAISRSGKAVFLSSGDGKERPDRGIDFAPRTGPFGMPVIQLDGSVILTSATGELLHRKASVAPTITLPETLILTAPPVGYGACAVGHEIVFADGARIVSPDNEAVVALAGDNVGHLYAATRHAVHVIAYDPPERRAEPFRLSSAEVKQGRVVTGGLAVGSGKLYVTTTAGVLVFEGPRNQAGNGR